MSNTYFALFGLEPAFDIDLTTLEHNFRKLQSEAHPDRFVSGTSAEKLKSMQTATLANEAFQTLKNPANRAKYLLELEGVNAILETNTAMPPAFLMQQMEWRERLEDLKTEKNITGLEALLDEMRTEAKSLQQELKQSFDKKHDLQGATEATRKLIFIDKVCEDINKAIVQLED